MKRFITFLRKRFSSEKIEATMLNQYIKNKQLKSNKFFDDYFDKKKLITDKRVLKRFKKNATIDKLFNIFEILNLEKKMDGVYYTKNNIIELMINKLVFKSTDKIIDISCGVSNFLYFIGKKIKYHNPMMKMKDIIENNLYGIDNSKLAVIRSEIVLNLLMIEFEEYVEIKPNIYFMDTLGYKFKQKYDYVIGNPPYIRIQNLETDTIKHIRENFRFAKEGNIDIYLVFLEIGLNIIKDSGKLIFIVSNTFFRSNCCNKFRKYLVKDNVIEKIINLEDVTVFDDTNTYTCIIQMSKNKTTNVIKYYNVTKKSELELVDEKDTDLPIIDNLVDKMLNKMLPIKKTENIVYKDVILKDNGESFVFHNLNLIKSIESFKSLGEYCHINCGIATLADSSYIIKPENEHNIEEDVLRYIVKASRLKDDVQNHIVKIVWPYDSKGKIIEENILKTKYPNCYKYLLSIRPRLDRRDRGKINKVGWYAFGRQQSIISSFGIKLLTSTMNLKPKFIEITDKNLTFYSGYSIKLKDHGNSMQKNCCLTYPILKKILESEIMEKYMLSKSRPYNGGWRSYTKSTMTNFGIPELKPSDVNHLTQLEDKVEINNFLYKLYGL